jgi:hypothetical protein
MKTETKHTKGEWTIFVHKECTYPGIECLSSQGNFSIACIGNDLEGIQGRTKEEAIANAKLIAAAPDMLEALIDLVEMVSPIIMKMGVKKVYRELLSIEQAKRAIRKAIE